MEIDEIYHEIGESGKQQIKYGAVLFLLKVSKTVNETWCSAVSTQE